MASSNNPIRLRAVEPEDLDLMYRIENDTETWDTATTTVPYSRYALHQYITNAHNDIYKDEQVRLVIEKEGTAIGFADLFRFEPLHLRAEIGLILLPEYRNQGLGPQVLQALTDYAKVIHLHQIYAIIAETNTPCLRLFAHSGFTQTALLPDWFCCEGKYVAGQVWQWLIEN